MRKVIKSVPRGTKESPRHFFSTIVYLEAGGRTAVQQVHHILLVEDDHNLQYYYVVEYPK
jgi:hypothetical protein